MPSHATNPDILRFYLFTQNALAVVALSMKENRENTVPLGMSTAHRAVVEGTLTRTGSALKGAMAALSTKDVIIMSSSADVPWK